MMRRCYNNGFCWSATVAPNMAPSLLALVAATTPGRCALAGKVGGWRRSSSAPLVLPSTRSTCCCCVTLLLLLSQMAPLIYLESKTTVDLCVSVSRVRVVVCKTKSGETSVISPALQFTY